MNKITKLSKEVLLIRMQQIILNELNKMKIFKIPIHLAIGHEAIAVALMNNVSLNDNVILSHRNIHYNLHNIKYFKKIIDEFKLSNKGISNGKYGSMNLFNPNNNIIYTSSILGNNLSVAAGVALTSRLKNNDNYVFVVTGDGGIEEGSFYESLLLYASLNLRVIIIVENNNWSLASSVEQRREKILLKKIVESLNGKYYYFKGNNFIDYFNDLKKIKRVNINLKRPIIIEVELETLGGYFVKENNKKRYINYHSGAIREIDLLSNVILKNSKKDPLFYVSRFLHYSKKDFINKINFFSDKYL